MSIMHGWPSRMRMSLHSDLFNRVSAYMSLSKIERIFEYERIVHTHAPQTRYYVGVFYAHINNYCAFPEEHDDGDSI